MSIRQTSIIVALVGLFVGGTVVLAEPLLKNQSSSSSLDSQQLLAQNTQDSQNPQNPRRRGQRGKFGQGEVLQELNLSEQQKQKLQTIKQKYQGQLQPLRENMKTLRQDLQTMMAGTASTKEIRAKHQQLVAARQKMGDLRFESMLEMREVLTPEQRTKFAQLMDQRRENARSRFNEPADGEE